MIKPLNRLDDDVLQYLLNELKDSPAAHEMCAQALQNLQIYQLELEQQNLELQEVQQALELSRDRYAELYEQAPVGFATLDRGGTVKQINLPGAKLLGAERQHIIGASLGRFLQHGQRRALLNHLARVSHSDASQTLDLQLGGEHGPPRVIRLKTDYAQPTRDKAVCHVAMLDVTEEQRVKNALKDSMQMIECAHMEWRDAFDAIRDPIFLHDAQGRILRANRAYAEAADEEIQNLAGRFYWQVFAKSAGPMQGCCSRAGAHRTEGFAEEILMEDGRTFHTRAFSAHDSNGDYRYSVHVMDDISSLKQAEQSIAEERKFLQTVIDGVIDPIMVIGTDHEILMSNRAATQAADPHAELGLEAKHCAVKHRHNPPRNGTREPSCYDDVIKSGNAQSVVHHYPVANGLTRTVESSMSPLRNDNGEVVGVIEASRDISEHLLLMDKLKRRELQLEHLAQHDPLTALPNRLLFADRLCQAIYRAHRVRKKVGLLFVDLDRFKKLNDSLGHPAGDQVLKEVSRRLCSLFREEDTVARLGGDEFTIVLSPIEHAQDAGLVAQKVLDVFQQPFEVEHQSLYMTTSVGISIYPDDGKSADALVKNADAAMYRAKEKGRNTFQFYTRDMTMRALEHVILESSLRRAMVNEEFELHYQPQIEMQSNRVTGIEALLRWNHPELGLLLPERFMQVAEETGIIIAIGTWVVRQACAQLCDWQSQGLVPDATIKVNLSRRQLEDTGFADKVEQILKETGLDSGSLSFEVTETIVMLDQERATCTLDKLCSIGTSISIDDFGTGYSSLSQLKSLPVNELKIDKSFVLDIVEDENDLAITRAILALGKSLNLRVIAEGVETEQQASLLRQEGCHLGQGYFYCRPSPAKQLESYIQNEV